VWGGGGVAGFQEGEEFCVKDFLVQEELIVPILFTCGVDVRDIMQVVLHTFLELFKIEVGFVGFGFIDAYFCGEADC
ncbi:MAG: hypothetical protein D3910_28575, partial [Candidatus Electrothrix sp. ATG2]|nr:hypothetical protein [Candidatus Electrothrix sp. ATG2]